MSTTARWADEIGEASRRRTRAPGVATTTRALQAGAFLAGVAGVTRLDGLTFQPMGGKASNSALVGLCALGAGLILRRYYPRGKQFGNGLLLASAGLGVGMLIRANRERAGHA